MRAVGYGGMLAEAFVALIAMVTVMIVAQKDLTGLKPGTIYGNGIGTFGLNLPVMNPRPAVPYPHNAAIARRRRSLSVVNCCSNPFPPTVLTIATRSPGCIWLSTKLVIICLTKVRSS